jgi:hypothetical protein
MIDKNGAESLPTRYLKLTKRRITKEKILEHNLMSRKK